MAGCGCLGNLITACGDKNQTQGNAEVYATTEGNTGMSHMKYYGPVHTEGVNCVAAVGKDVCVSGSKDQSVVLFNHSQGTHQQRWDNHEKEVTKVIYGSRINCCFSASRDKTVAMLQPGQENPVAVLKGHSLVVTAITLNTDNTSLCSGSRDNSVRLWDVHTKQCIKDSSLSRNLITHAHWAPGGGFIAQTGEDKEVKLWDSQSLQLIKAFPKKQHIQTWCQVSTDDHYCLTCSNGFGGNGCEATLWDIRTGSIVHVYRGHHETTHCAIFLSTEASKGQKLIATSSSDGTVKIWDQNSAVCVGECAIPGGRPLTSIAAYDDGSLCVSSMNTGIHLLHMSLSPQGDVQLQETAQF